MRASSEMPRSRRRLSGRGRIVLLLVLVALFVLFTSLSGIAGFYTDYLWFDSLGLTSVWRTVLGAKVALTAIFVGVFFLALFVNLTIADRLAPTFRPPGPEEELLARYHDAIGSRARLLRVAVSFVLALIAGVGVSSQWNEWILFTNRVDFGVKDPQFDIDVGFYVFQLPFLSFVVSWLFASFVIILLVTAVAHYLNGGIRMQTPGQRVTPQVKAHLSVLLGVLSLIKAADYWLQRYELTFSTRGAVDGATYTDVNAQLPAIQLLILVALLSFGLFIANIWRRGWVLPAVTVGLWALATLVMGNIYPAIVQRFTVEPAESSREAPYIERNIQATRTAMGLDDVEVKAFDYTEDLDAQQLIDNDETIRNIRLLDPGIVQDTYQRLQAERGFYRFADLDVDRYVIDGTVTQVVASTRELNTEGIPQDSWEGRHVAFTHGYGIAISPANAVTSTGRPDFQVGDIPVRSEVEGIEITQPQVYVGEGLDDYAVVGASRDEVDYQGDNVTEQFRYDGDDGVEVGSLLRQAAFALRFQTPNFVFSNFVTEDSKVIYNRDIRERVEALAPFLEWDADPYPVVRDGRIFYVLDGYTTTSRYPYAQRADNQQLTEGSGLSGRFNYARNSVKAVVDTYDGTVSMYQTEVDDPILDAYRKAFPDLFSDFDEMPADIKDHLRYPEDLFRVQTNMWARYHIDGAQDFYEQTGGWEVAQDPGTDILNPADNIAAATETTEVNRQRSDTRNRIDPQYLLMRLPGESQEEFLILRSFVPTSEDDERQELTSFMVAKSDPDDYGKLQVFEMGSTLIDGPAIVDSNIQSEEDIAARISLLNQRGSRVRLGNLLLIPIEQSILYVRPLYVEAEGTTPVPELKNVIVAFGARVEMRPTLKEALEAVFGEAPETLEDAPAADRSDGTTEPDSSAGDQPTAEDGQPVADLLQEAEDLFTQADQALADGDLGRYQDLIRQAEDLIGQALDASAAATSGSGDSGSDGSGSGDAEADPSSGDT